MHQFGHVSVAKITYIFSRLKQIAAIITLICKTDTQEATVEE